MEYTTHASLLARVAEGLDPAAWSEFHERYGELIRGFAIRRGIQRADCDDIAQDVLTTLTRSMSRFEYDPARGKFRSYLKTLVIRAIFRRFRQNRGEVALGVDGMEPANDDAQDSLWEEEWRQHHVRRAMQGIEAEFSEHDRMAFSHYAIKGLSAAEAASATGLSVDQVYQAKSRIVKRLGELIAEQVEDEG